MPCQILIKRQDNQYDPANPDRVVWRRGDPVVCRPDTWVWGADEDPDTSVKFYVVTISDRTYDQLKDLVESYSADPDGNPTRMRAYEVRLTDLDPLQLGTLESTGRLSLTFQQARTLIRNKATGQGI